MCTVILIDSGVPPTSAFISLNPASLNSLFIAFLSRRLPASFNALAKSESAATLSKNRFACSVDLLNSSFRVRACSTAVAADNGLPLRVINASVRITTSLFICFVMFCLCFVCVFCYSRNFT